MKYVLVGSVLGRSFRAVLAPGTRTVGSAPDNDVRLADPTVSRRHAVLEAHGGGVAVRDLGSSNGTYLDGRRVTSSTAMAGAVLAFGSVELALHAVEDDDLEAGLPLPAPAQATHRPGAPGSTAIAAPAATTLGVQPLDSLLLERLPDLLEAAAGGCGEATAAARAGSLLLEALPVARLEIARHGGGVLFAAGGEPEGTPGTGTVRVFGDLEARATFRDPGAARALCGALDLVLRLVDLARPRARRGGPPPLPAPPPVPDPPSLAPEVQSIYRDAGRVARGEVSVLLRGESGTGKEVLARYLHDASGRPPERFVALNCAALPRDLLEAELFGVERGAATGVDARPGRFELAHEGTLFLDEIGDMSPETQARVLRVIQEGSCHRLGGVEARPARPRIVSATNRDLRALLADGAFRADLYHRIAGWEVELPPLRRRSADVPNLAVHFLAEEARRRGVALAGISRRALRALQAFPWPGNVRQLQQEVTRAALFLEDGDLLDTRVLSPDIARHGAETGANGLKERLARHERSEIETALQAVGGDVARAAEALEIHRATLYRRMKALGIG